MSLKFLNQKSFHPGNKQSQKKLFIAEERDKENKKREQERAKEVLNEQEYIKNRALLSGSKLEADRSKVSFLYSLPTSIIQESEKEKEEKLKLQQQQQQQIKNDKDLKDYEKFPILLNAPTTGNISSDIKLVHKPLGVLINNVKCARCHKWGHRSGDRECPLIDSNPNELKVLQMNDPMMNYNSNNGNKTVEDIVENMNNQDDDDDDDDQVEREFLASLTKKQRKLLLKQIKLEEKEAKRKKRKKEKREKRKHNNNNNSDNSDYSSSSSDDDDNKRYKKRNKSSSTSKRKHHHDDDHNDYKERD